MSSSDGGGPSVELMGFLESVQLDSYLSALQLAGGSALPSLFSNSSINSTLFVPNNDAFSHANETTRGYSFQLTNPSFIRALLSYHAALGSWPLQQPSLFHTIIPTALQGEGYSDLDNDKPQVISCLTTADEQGALKTTFPNEKNSPSVVSTMTFEGYTIQVLDQVLGIPGQYLFEYNNSQLFQFEDLRVAVGGEDFEDMDGFTAFAPANNGMFFTEAQVRFPSTKALTSLYNNHVIYGKTVWSSDLTKEIYTAQSGFNYSFATTTDGNITISLNGITTNITVADVLVSNGVIHLLDDALWNLTPDSGPTSSLSSSTTSPTAAPQPSPTSDAVSKNSDISSGIIAAIVVSAIVVLVLLSVATLYIWRYYHALGVRELTRRNEALDGSITPTALHTSPFDSRIDIAPQAPADELRHRLETPTQSSSNFSPVTSIGMLEKQGYRPDSVSSGPSYGRASSATLSHGQSMSMSDEVVERLLQTLAQRIDRGPGTPQAEEPMMAPPGYRASDQ